MQKNILILKQTTTIDSIHMGNIETKIARYLFLNGITLNIQSILSQEKPDKKPINYIRSEIGRHRQPSQMLISTYQ